jgi:hypothetical protein
MNTRSLTGWLLIAGPVLTFVILGGLYPALVGGQATPLDSVKEMMAKPELARLLLGLGSVVFVSTFIGLALLARSMQGDDTAGGAYATLAGIISVGLATIGIAATGLSAGALQASETSVEIAVNIEAVSAAMFSGLFFFWGITNLLLGVAIVMQKNLHVVIGWLFVLIGAFIVITVLVDIDFPDVVGFAIWIGMSLVTAAAGVLTLRAK